MSDEDWYFPDKYCIVRYYSDGPWGWIRDRNAGSWAIGGLRNGRWVVDSTEATWGKISELDLDRDRGTISPLQERRRKIMLDDED